VATVQLKVELDPSGAIKNLKLIGGEIRSTGSIFDGFRQSLLSGLGLGAGFKVGTLAAEGLLSVVRAIPAAFAAWTTAALAAADNLSNLSATTRISVEGLQKLERIGAPFGVSMETMARGALNLQRRLELTPKAFGQFGLDVERLKGLEPEQMFEEVANAIAAMHNPTEQAAASMKLLGDKSGEMLRVIRDGIKPVEDFGELSSQQVKALDDLGDATGEAEKAFENLTIQLAATIAQSPEILAMIKDIAAGFGGMAAAVRDNGAFITRWASDTLVAFETLIPALDQLHRGFQLMASNPQIKTPVFDPSKIAPPSMGMGGPTGDALLQLVKGIEEAEKKAGEAAKRAASEAEAAAKKQIDAMSKGMAAFFDEIGKRRTAIEGLGGLLGPSVSDATTEMGRLWAATEQLGGVAELSDAQLIKLVNDMRELALQGGENEAGFQTLAAAMEEAGNRGDHVARAVGFVTEAAQRAAPHVQTLAERMRELEKTLGGATEIVDAFSSALGQMGVSADSGIAKTVDGLGDIGHSLTGLAGAMASGDPFKIIAASIGVLGGVVSGFKKIWDSIFGNKEIMHVNDLRDAFLDAHGGWLALQKELAQFSTEDIVKKIFDAETVEEFNRAVQEALDALAKGRAGAAPTAPGPGDGGQVDTGPTPEDIPHYPTGTPWVPQTGLAVVHRGERIIPAHENRGSARWGGERKVEVTYTVNAPIDANPLNTAETQKQLSQLVVTSIHQLAQSRNPSFLAAIREAIPQGPEG
jgi:methyl-accepting chemotaxis protein